MNIIIPWKRLGEVTVAGRYTVKGIGYVDVDESIISAAPQFDKDVKIELTSTTAATDLVRSYRILHFVP